MPFTLSGFSPHINLLEDIKKQQTFLWGKYLSVSKHDILVTPVPEIFLAPSLATPTPLLWLATFLNLSRLAPHQPCSVEFWLPLIKTREKNATKKLTFPQRIVTKYNIPKRNTPKFINIHKKPKVDYDISAKQLTKCELRTFCAKIAKQSNYCTKSNQTCFFFIFFRFRSNFSFFLWKGFASASTLSTIKISLK